MKRIGILLLLAGCVGSALGAVTGPGREPAVPDSASPADSMSARGRGKITFAPTGADLKSPGLAVLCSALCPGGGQLYTRNYLAAVVIGGGQTALEYFVIRDHLRALDCRAKGDTVGYFRYRDRRNNLLWWTASAWVFSLAHAYVSANMYRFTQDEKLGLVISPSQVGLRARW